MQGPAVRGRVCSDSYPARTKYISLIQCVRTAHAHRVNDNNRKFQEFLLSFNSDMYVVQVEPVQSSW